VDEAGAFQFAGLNLIRNYNLLIESRAVRETIGRLLKLRQREVWKDAEAR
jgi:hypothetical protein